jgi:hypothetical protein
MFVYSNATKDKIYINVNSNKPLNTPDYSLDIVDGILYVNGQAVNRYETIELTPDQVFDTAYMITKPTYININDTVITCPDDTAGDGVFHVVNDGVLTISGNGKINSVGNNDYCMAIWADGGKVVINGGTYTNVGAGDHDHYDLLYVKNGGILEINGGYFECQTPRWTLNSNNTAPGTIIVKGGTFVGYNPAKSYTDENGTDFTNFVADGYTVKQEGNLFTVYKK